MTDLRITRQEGTLRPVDRWAGTDGEYDRRAGADGAFDRWPGSDREYDDRWPGPDREYDRRAGTDREYDRWDRTDREYDRWDRTDDPYDRWAENDREYHRRAGSDRHNDDLAETDGRYDRRDRRTGQTRRPMVKWVSLLIAWVLVSGLLLAVHLTILVWVIMVGLIGYVVYAILRETPRAEPRTRRRRATIADNGEAPDEGRERFNAPPGWPEPPPGWTPPPGWQPNPSWPPAPSGWQFWLSPTQRGSSDRTARIRHHRSQPDEDGFTDGWR